MERNVILKYLRGETSPEERIKMLRWLEEDPAHLEEYKYLRRIFDATLCNEENIPLSIHSSRSTNRRIWMQIAAAVAFICLFAGGTWLYTQHLSENQAELLAARDIHVPVGTTYGNHPKRWNKNMAQLQYNPAHRKPKRKRPAPCPPEW